MSNFSNLIFNEHHFRSAPLANAKMFYNGQEYGALLYRGENDISPGQLPDLNRWMHVFTQYNRTAMIGDPSSFRTTWDTNKFFWAEMTGYMTIENSYTINRNNYDPGPEWPHWGGFAYTPNRIANGGIVRYQNSNFTRSMYCVFINGKMVYSTLDFPPYLFTFPAGFVIGTFERIYQSGYGTNLYYLSRLLVYNKYGDTKSDWYVGATTYILGSSYATLARDVRNVTLYDSNNQYITSTTFSLGQSTTPEARGWVGTAATGHEVYSKEYCPVIWADFEIPPSRSQSQKTSLYLQLYENNTIPSGKRYDELYYWVSWMITSQMPKERWSNINYWSYCPLQLDTSGHVSYSNLVTHGNVLSTAKLNPVFLYPGNTGNSSYYNWGVYLDEDDNDYFVFRSYQNCVYHWTVRIEKRSETIYDTGTRYKYRSRQLINFFVDVPLDIYNSRGKTASVYLIFKEILISGDESSSVYTQNVEGVRCYIKKCTLNRLDHMHSMSESDFTFTDIDITNQVYNFNHPAIDEKKYHALPFGIWGYNRVGSTQTPVPGPGLSSLPNGDQWHDRLFSGGAYNDELFQVYDYKGNQLSPYGSKYAILESNFSLYEKNQNGIYGYGDYYDLSALVINLEDIEGSLNYINSE